MRAIVSNSIISMFIFFIENSEDTTIPEINLVLIIIVYLILIIIVYFL